MKMTTKRNYKKNRLIRRVLEIVLFLEIVIILSVIFDTYVSIRKYDEEQETIEEKIDNEPIVIPVRAEIKSKEKTESSEKKSEKKETKKHEQIAEGDIELLAQLMYAEEGIYLQKYKDNIEKAEMIHKLAGSVVIHRKENKYMGAETIEDVIYTKGQYHEQTIKRVTDGQEVPDIIYEWAEDLIKNGAIGPDNLIYQSEFKQGTVYKHIGNQYFGTEEIKKTKARV